MENELPVFDRAKSTGGLAYSAANARVGWALRREFAEASGRVLLDIDNSTGVLELSSQPVSYSALADCYAKISDNPVEEKSFDDG